MKEPIAICYRAGSGSCTQYPFFSIEEMKGFFSRKPYSGEYFVVMYVVERKPGKKYFMFADRVAAFVEENIGAA